MSGYRNSGLTREQYDDRETLQAAAEVLTRRWGLEYEAGSLKGWADAIEGGVEDGE